MNTITPVVTPQQQMALAFRDFTLPEGTVLPDGKVKVWAFRPSIDVSVDWAEAIGRDPFDAVERLVKEIARPGKSRFAQ